jgi:dihydrofolate reductase
MIRLIAAIDSKRGLAKDGVMPWSIPDDERYFTEQTKTHGGNVLTGGRTFREGYKGRPLSGRQNFILTHDMKPIEGVTTVQDLQTFLDDFRGDLWIAGGEAVFRAVMDAGKADELYLTHIDADFGCDQFFPKYDSFRKVEESPVHTQNGHRFTYARYVRS